MDKSTHAKHCAEAVRVPDGPCSLIIGPCSFLCSIKRAQPPPRADCRVPYLSGPLAPWALPHTPAKESASTLVRSAAYLYRVTRT